MGYEEGWAIATAVCAAILKYLGVIWQVAVVIAAIMTVIFAMGATVFAFITLVV